VDVGAGDGRFAIETARAEPRTLAIALDASTDKLVDGSRTATRRRLPNMLFVVSAIEQLPRELEQVADEATVHFPWGALLRGLACGDGPVLEPLARIAKPGGTLRLVLQSDEVAVAALEGRGFHLVHRHVASAAEIAATRSSWAKRLGIGPARPAFVFDFLRCS
jgi:ubiquinone/menaquinone biosynthesis C-methylase UbiE